jgi:hypothetical protein
MRLLFTFALLFLLLSVPKGGIAQVVKIQGFVRTAEGKPIQDVYIKGFGKTDERGYFKLASDVLIRYWKILIFDKKGFIPKVISLDASNTNLSIILEPEKGDDSWDVPGCQLIKTDRSRVVGQYLKLTAPKNWKFKSGVDADYIYYSIGFKEGGKQHWLRGGLGNLYGDVYPNGETLLALQNYSYRRTSLGIDWHGITKEGKYWRYFGAPALFETYHYETDSKEAADRFDKILDGVCFQQNK